MKTRLPALLLITMNLHVLANEDIANGRVTHISNAALLLLLEAKLGEAPPAPAPTFTPGDVAEFGALTSEVTGRTSSRLSSASVTDISTR